MRGVYLAGVNRVKSCNGSNLGALGTGALRALSIGALASLRAGRHGLPEPAARCWIFPTENTGPGGRRVARHLATEKPDAAPSIFPNGNARTATSPPDLGREAALTRPASRRAARPGPPLDKAHQAMIGV